MKRSITEETEKFGESGDVGGSVRHARLPRRSFSEGGSQ